MNTNTNTAPALREAFEHHWYDTYHSGTIRSGEDGRYWPPEVQKSWEAWQACAALPTAAQPPAGWAMVPVEPTPEMRQAGGHANSEWLNDNAPIGESRYAMPMKSVWDAMLAAAPRATKPEPVQPERVLLSEEQITEIWSRKPRYHAAPIGYTDLEFARDIEAAAHGIQPAHKEQP